MIMCSIVTKDTINCIATKVLEDGGHDVTLTIRHYTSDPLVLIQDDKYQWRLLSKVEVESDPIKIMVLYNRWYNRFARWCERVLK